MSNDLPSLFDEQPLPLALFAVEMCCQLRPIPGAVPNKEGRISGNDSHPNRKEAMWCKEGSKYKRCKTTIATATIPLPIMPANSESRDCLNGRDPCDQFDCKLENATSILR